MRYTKDVTDKQILAAKTGANRNTIIAWMKRYTEMVSSPLLNKLMEVKPPPLWHKSGGKAKK